MLKRITRLRPRCGWLFGSNPHVRVVAVLPMCPMASPLSWSLTHCELGRADIAASARPGVGVHSQRPKSYGTRSLSFNGCSGMVTRYSAWPFDATRSKRPPMLGGPDWPPRNVDERSSTRPPPFQLLHVPESSRAGGVTRNWRSTLRLRVPSPYTARTSRRSPFRVPLSDVRVNRETSSPGMRFSTGLCGCRLHTVNIMPAATRTDNRDCIPSV